MNTMSERLLVTKRKIIDRINSFRKLKENWDCYNANSFDATTIDNAILFFDSLDTDYLNILSVDDICPTPNATITIEVRKDRNIVSVEIGNKYYNYFAEINGNYLDQEQILTSTIPVSLNQALQQIYIQNSHYEFA